MSDPKPTKCALCGEHVDFKLHHELELRLVSNAGGQSSMYFMCPKCAGHMRRYIGNRVKEVYGEAG